MLRDIKLQVTLKIDIDNTFCMSKGDTIEFFEDGFKMAGTSDDYYPNFGPYIELNEIARLMNLGQGNDMMHKMFEVKQIK